MFNYLIFIFLPLRVFLLLHVAEDIVLKHSTMIYTPILPQGPVSYMKAIVFQFSITYTVHVNFLLFHQKYIFIVDVK